MKKNKVLNYWQSQINNTKYIFLGFGNFMQFGAEIVIPLNNMECSNKGPVSEFAFYIIKYAFLLTVHVIIMQMVRGLWPACHALLRKPRSGSDVCCAHRPEAN